MDHEFNIANHVPKKDLCNLCEEHKRTTAMSPELTEKFEKHSQGKLETKSERDKDRKFISKSTTVVTFDLENVLLCPKANVSCFFYMRKLTVFNLTAHVSDGKHKEGYCAIWHEGIGGRGGNDIASALVKILGRVVSDFPNTLHLILWSDSCIAQNKNSIISTALKIFMKDTSCVKSITQKFGEAGHSPVQEVDNMHSIFYRTLKFADFYSPLSLVRIILHDHRTRSFQVLQLTPNCFRDFHVSFYE